MDYEEFLDYIKDNLADCFEKKEQAEMCLARKEKEPGRESERTMVSDCYEVELHKVVKNNGIELDGVTIRKKGEFISPNIYLNPYYESYQMGKPLSVIMDEIICHYRDVKEQSDLEIDDVTDFAAVRDKIILRLVNYDRNRQQLKGCPHRRYLDLAVTFRYVASRDAMGIATSLITDQEYKNWNVGLDELYQIALFNTMRELPWQMESLVKVITDCVKARMTGFLPGEIMADMEEMGKQESGVDMYVLTNDAGINGATCILYDNVIRNFARVRDSNLFLLPSSIHEIMLVPEDEDTKPDFLSELLLDANQSSVGYIDLLSDHIYYYDKSSDQISIYQ